MEQDLIILKIEFFAAFEFLVRAFEEIGLHPEAKMVHVFPNTTKYIVVTGTHLNI